MKFQVAEYRLPIINHPASRNPLYPHQVAVWEGWDKHRAILLTAKTGTGKTRAAMLPLLKRGESAVVVYPTNELLRDQVRAVEQFACSEGVETAVWVPEKNDWPRYSRADHVLVPVDAAILDEWQKVTHCKSRVEALHRLLDPHKPQIVFTNSDILFLILGLHYHAEALEALRRYQTLVIDEFHLYAGVELTHALVMVALARGLGIFRRLLLLSATPDPEVREVLGRVLDPALVDSDWNADRNQTSFRTAVHAVEVLPIQAAGADQVELIVDRVTALKGELERLRTENPADEYLPAVLVVNSVVNAIRLEDRLVESGFARDCLAIIRGLSNRAIRKTSGKLLAIGTSAIEVGVDFHCDYLVFEASEAASFLQRFGRVGRHKPGRAIALVPPNAFQAMAGIQEEIDRGRFEACIHNWYPSSSPRSWFASTEYGMITARSLAENLISTVANDRQGPKDILLKLRERIEAILGEHANRLGCPELDARARAAFERCAAGKKGARWIKTYCRLNRFRTSLPSVRVHDFTEQHRRHDWQLGEYEADLVMLLKRGVGIEWNRKLQMLTIRGVGAYHRVHASEIFTDNDCGVILETQDWQQLRLYQDDVSTPVSDLMAKENHIFVVVPRSLVEDRLDWRTPVLEAGKYLLAFDGAALLLLELSRRH